MKMSEILRAGKQRIEQFGWVQGDEAALSGERGNRKCCAATAIQDSSNWVDGLPAAELFQQVVCPASNISHWNDQPERTMEDVLAAYDKAIAAAEARESHP